MSGFLKQIANPKSIHDNLSHIGFLFTLLIGGGTLLAYALSIGELPEFTLGDLTGTLIAVAATGVLVVGVVAVYCLFAGLFARGALEWFYPMAAQDLSAADARSEQHAPYGRLTRGPFIIGATLFGFLIWVSLAVCALSEQLSAQHDLDLRVALIVALPTLAALIFADWPKGQRLFAKQILLSCLLGALAMLVVLLAAYSNDSGDLITKKPSTAQVVVPPWKPDITGALDHVYLIGGLVAGLGLIWARGDKLATRIRSLRPVGIPQRWSAWIAKAHPIKLSRQRNQLLLAKLAVIAAFGLCGIGLVYVAAMFSSMGDLQNQGWIVLGLSLQLTVLNWATFSSRAWKDRVLLGVTTALVLFLLVPLFTHNSIFLPKTVMSMLGLGERHVDSVAISSRQCAVLAPYGVTCVADGDRAVTLRNVNLLNRLGGSMVFELLVRRIHEHPAPQVGPPDRTGNDLPQSARENLTPKTLEMATVSSQATKGSAPTGIPEHCDRSLWGELNDEVRKSELTCVHLVVPKDQVSGYTPAGNRSYRGDYTQYILGLPKAPTIIRLPQPEPLR